MPLGLWKGLTDKPVVRLLGLPSSISGAGAAWPFIGCQGFPTVPSLSVVMNPGLLEFCRGLPEELGKGNWICKR